MAKLIVGANCLAGQHFTVDMHVVQGAVSGAAHDAGQCEGALTEYPVTVVAQGRQGFATGPAAASATIGIRQNGQVIDTQRWTRQITITP